MLFEIINTLVIYGEFCFADMLIKRLFYIEGIYYLLHSVHNWIIVDLTLYDVVNTLSNFNYIQSSERNNLAIQYVYALHLYHLTIYWHKFNFNDILHHLLMIGVALPIGTITNSRSLLGYGLFFTTGLPGAINYFLLFLTRNQWLNRNVEKNVNAWLNTWIRAPGCVSHATLILVLISLNTVKYSIDWWLGIIVASLSYWNGLYFMRQVIENNIEYTALKANLNT